jgi:translation elongation factor EF-Ts
MKLTRKKRSLLLKMLLAPKEIKDQVLQEEIKKILEEKVLLYQVSLK